ncbi:MAG: dihydroorotate dehydrogenase electron transfer subunit [Candidatus Micrarchaeia archaeon]
MSEIYRVFRIEKVIAETDRVKSFVFDGKLESRPGQFVMAWLPGVGERPMSIANDEPFTLTIANRGFVTNRMHALKEGDRLWVRGPYGNWFRLQGKKIVLVAGGTGLAPMRFLIKEAAKQGIETCVFMGARTKAALLARPPCPTIVATDDGSEGFKGFVTGALEAHVAREKPDCVYACGPERMMADVLHICERAGIPCQLSLERYMRCGFGVCGACAIDGFLVCRHGPVFTSEAVKRMADFGKFARDASGKRIPV